MVSMHKGFEVYNTAYVQMLTYIGELCIYGMYSRATE